MNKQDIWAALAAPFPADTVFDAKGDYLAQRFDNVVPGEWDLTLAEMPGVYTDDTRSFAFKARVQVLGVIREGVGEGNSYPIAAVAAFTDAARRFGVIAGTPLRYIQPEPGLGDDLLVASKEAAQQIARDTLSAFEKAAAPGAETPAEMNDNLGRQWNPADDEPPFPSEPASAATSPAAAPKPAPAPAPAPAADRPAESTSAPTNANVDAEQVRCPKCSGKMWDNRISKRNPKAPDFKCRDRSCDGVIWPPKPAPAAAAAKAPAKSAHDVGYIKGLDDPPAADSAPVASGTDDIPF